MGDAIYGHYRQPLLPALPSYTMVLLSCSFSLCNSMIQQSHFKNIEFPVWLKCWSIILKWNRRSNILFYNVQGCTTYLIITAKSPFCPSSALTLQSCSLLCCLLSLFLGGSLAICNPSMLKCKKLKSPRNTNWSGGVHFDKKSGNLPLSS